MNPVTISAAALLCATTIFVAPHALFPFDGFALLYIGPDQIMPLTSVLAGVVGVLMMFWNRVVGVFRRIREFCSRR